MFDKKSIIEQLLKVIREKGYAGMSLSCISEATGLKKSSIYHFFPDGKNQIALEIIKFADQMLSEKFLQLAESGDAYDVKFNKTLNILSEFYGKGNSSCLLDVMTIDNNDEQTQKAIKQLLLKLINVFKALFQEAGLDERGAHLNATDIVVRLQGALVICRVTKETQYFADVISSLRIEAKTT